MTKRTFFAWPFFFLALAACTAEEKGPAARLSSPYPVEAAPAKIQESDIACKEPPEDPVRDLRFTSFYKKGDSTRSTVDPEAEDIYRKETRGLFDFETELVKMTNAYLISGKRDADSALCALRWLENWARADAFLRKSNRQGDFMRQWSLAAVASAYLQVRPVARQYPERQQRIESWLDKVAERVKSEYPHDYYRQTQRDSLKNNHLNWAAWAVLISGIATDNDDNYDWGVEKARYALLVQASPEGFFPLELMRGKKAMQYHVFAAGPLVMIAEAAWANGDNIYDLRGGMLHQIVAQIIANLEDDSGMEKASGMAQEDLLQNISLEHFAWMEPYNARFPTPRIERFLERNRPFFARRLGGDLTALFAGRDSKQRASNTPKT